MLETVQRILSPLGPELSVFIISMLPLIEARGGVIVGALLEMPWYEAYLIAVIGNMLPVPFILLLMKRILAWMKKVRYLDRIALFLEKHAQKKSKKLKAASMLGIIIFVGIPLPGTGAITGSLILSLFDHPLKQSIPAIFIGVLIAAFILCAISYGFMGAIA